VQVSRLETSIGREEYEEKTINTAVVISGTGQSVSGTKFSSSIITKMSKLLNMSIHMENILGR
jgi:hypothetical protein